MARQRHGSDVRRAALHSYDELTSGGIPVSHAQVEIAHDLGVSVATVQRWIRDRRNQQEREKLLHDPTPLPSPSPDWDHVADDTPLGRAQREAAYRHFGEQLAQFHAVALRKHTDFAERYANDPESYLESTLQLAAATTQVVSDALKVLVMLGISNDIPANRLANWSNIAPATVRLWEQEGERAVEQYKSDEGSAPTGQ